MDYVLLDWDPPKRIEWQEDDGHDLIKVTYQLAPVDGGTRFTQRDYPELSAPKLLHPLMRAGIGADIAGQLRRLRRHLERR
jgi:Polyketide cyclase / dehydrase and lipid transport